MATTAAPPPNPPHVARRSRWPYVLNFVALAILALAAVIGIDYIGKKYTHRFDLTTGGQHTLSSQTKALLAKIDQGDQKYELANAMLVPANPSEETLEHYQKVEDLLKTYANASSNISVLNADAVNALPLKIADRYAGQTKPYKAALQAFDALEPQLKALFDQQSRAVNAYGRQPKLTPADTAYLRLISRIFSQTLPNNFDGAMQNINAMRNRSTLPQWSAIAEAARNALDSVSSTLGNLTDQNQLAQVPAGVATYLKSQQDTLDHFVHDKIEPVLKQLQGLKTPESETLINQLDNADIVVLGPKKVDVLADSNVFVEQQPEQSNPQAPPPQPEFEGEQAISTALLAQAMPNKPKVVFVSPSPQSPNAMYAMIMDRLKKANFDVLTWSPAGESGMMGGSMGGPPPAEGKGVTWVVLPAPPQSPQQMMMGAPPADTSAVHAALKKHLDAGGAALLLAEAQGMPTFGRTAQGYAYQDLLAPFGVQVESNYTVVQRYMVGDRAQTAPQLEITRYPQTKITKPLQSLPMILAGYDMNSGAPTVVKPAENPPAGAHPELLLQAMGPDVWGESSSLGTPTFDPKTDLAAPVPMGVMSSGPHDAKVVVIGNALFATDQAVGLPQAILTDTGIYNVPKYPGNAEMVLNSVYWLAGYDNMIAVSPHASVALRIKDVTPAALSTIHWGVLWVGAPLLALVIGWIVFMLRR